MWLAALRGLPESATYAELLFRAGFLDARRLLGTALGWRALLTQLRPNLLVVDHAPTALLASRNLDLPRASIGTGFFQPPRAVPIPAFRTWEAIDAARVAESELRALATANAVLDAMGAPPLGCLGDLLAVDEAFLLTLREADHYPERATDPATRYWGPLEPRQQGIAPHWPAGPGPKVFAYLKAEYGPAEAILQGLGTASLRTCAYVSGLSPEARQRWTTPQLVFVAAPADMHAVVASADVVLCNAGSGTATAALVAGLPLVLLPMHAEQLLFSMRIQAHGAGRYYTEAQARTQAVEGVRCVAEDETYRRAAAAIAARHKQGALLDVAAAVAERFIALATRST